MGISSPDLDEEGEEEEEEDDLAVANVLHRKTRTAVAALAVAVSVATVMLLVGMANGTLAAIASRLLSVGADVLFQPPDSSLILGVSSAVVPLRMADLLRQTPGVTIVNPGPWSA